MNTTGHNATVIAFTCRCATQATDYIGHVAFFITNKQIRQFLGQSFCHFLALFLIISHQLIKYRGGFRAFIVVKTSYRGLQIRVF